MENKQLKNYETVIIISGSYSQEEYKKALDKIKDYMKDLITIEEVEELGLKKLAYEVKKQKTGYYIIIDFKSVFENIKELERLYKIDDNVLKFIIVKKDD